MGRTIQLIRGTTEQNDNYVGPAGSLTYDTQRKSIRVHDGSSGGARNNSNSRNDS